MTVRRRLRPLVESPPHRAFGAVVARFVHTEEVTGSNPVTPTISEPPCPDRGVLSSRDCGGRCPSPRTSTTALTRLAAAQRGSLPPFAGRRGREPRSRAGRRRRRSRAAGIEGRRGLRRRREARHRTDRGPARGRRTGGGLSAAAAGGAAYKLAGGGIVGIIAMVVVTVLVSGGLGGSGDAPNAVGAAPTTDLAQACRSGADADTKAECRIVAAVNSVQAFWASEMQGSRAAYRRADTVFFTDAVSTGCGQATSDVGPFYCPVDETVYLDLGFFDELRTRFGAQGGASPRPTSSRTSTDITCSTWPGSTGSWGRTGRERRAGPCASSCRPTARRGLGAQRRAHRVRRLPHADRRPGRARRRERDR